MDHFLPSFISSDSFEPKNKSLLDYLFSGFFPNFFEFSGRFGGIILNASSTRFTNLRYITNPFGSNFNKYDKDMRIKYSVSNWVTVTSNTDSLISTQVPQIPEASVIDSAARFIKDVYNIPHIMRHVTPSQFRNDFRFLLTGIGFNSGNFLRAYDIYYRNPLTHSYIPEPISEKFVKKYGSPALISEKFEREWLASKNTAITNYSKESKTWYQLINNSKSKMLQNWLRSVNSGKWNAGIEKVRDGTKNAQNYASALNSMSSISDSKLQKIEDGIVQQRLVNQFTDKIFTLIQLPSQGGLILPSYTNSVMLKQVIQWALTSKMNEIDSVMSLETVLETIKPVLIEKYGFEEL